MIDHQWDISPKRAMQIQQELAPLVRAEPLTGRIDTVAGTDCAFIDAGKKIIAAAVLCRAATMEVISSACFVGPCRFPYIPGLLSFREAPAVIEAVRRLPARADLLMCDGQGVAHPRRLGLASHVGLVLDMPTIGVAKSRLCGAHRPVSARRGCRVQLRDKGEVIGAVVRTRSNVKPLYVSLGHRITLDEAVRWTLRCCRGLRLAEPTRRAHQYVTHLRTTPHLLANT
ncbi:MAG: deoxyribonuclease V [Planctomycetes bacterium]|nr:deoxyribonuclease V [Planctomycetota bacterium]